MKDTLIVLGLVGVLIGTCVGGGFYYGRRYERVAIYKTIPKQFDLLCQQCEEVGEKAGAEKGYHEGLRTCDDALQELDGKGRY